MNLQDRLARLSPEQRRLLAQRLQKSTDGAANPSDIPRRSGERRSFPLSTAQERLWFEHQLDAEGSHYNEAVVLRVRGPLRLDWIEQALAGIVSGHDILRACFREQDGEVVQIVAASVAVTIRLEDLGHRDQGVATLQSKLREEVCRPFDLANPPLFRMTAFRVAPDEHVLVFVVHHIVFDGWAAAGVFRELFARYEALRDGTSSDRAEPPLQYGDYSLWERERLASGQLDAQRDYWMRELPEALHSPALPYDRPRPSAPGTRGGRVVFRLDRALGERLRDLSRAAGTTLFVTLAAAYGLLLSRLSQSEEIVLAVPSTTRDRPELETMLGLFINTLLLRLPVDHRKNFESYLADVHRLTTQARDNQLYPFERIVEHLRRRQDLGPVPLTAVMFDVQRLPAGITPQDLTIAYLDVDVGTSKFDLGLSIKDVDNEFVGTFEYRSALFDAATVEGIARQYVTLLTSIVRTPQAAVSELSALCDADRELVVSRINRTSLPFADGWTLHALLDAQASALPDREAVLCGNERITFRELSEASNRLARHLRACGVVRRSPVVLMMERSVDLIVGLFAILKAGGAYVPVDPVWPEARIAAVLGDLGAEPIVLTHRGLTVPAAAQVIRTDREHEALAAQSTDPLPEPGDPADLAYVLYTSGSTGRPKGVMICHRSVVNLLTGLEAAVYAPLGSDHLRVAVNGSIAFDTSVKQIIQLLAGHSLVLVPEEIRADSAAFVDFLGTQRIDVLDCTPSQLNMLAAGGLLEPGKRAPRCVLVGGEAIDQTLWTHLRDADHIRFVNLYGPTECTVDATFADVASSFVPVIGTPLANVQVYVLDDGGCPVPPGTPGELFIGGEGVAKGYLGDPVLTAQRFVPDPFTNRPEARLYRTGDRVRLGFDGRLAFIGRTDEQVKLRGYRIEPGEIRAALKEHPGVGDAAVVAQGEGADKRIVAYVVAERESSPVVDGQARHRLPNGLAVVELNRNETEFLYEEMFVLEAYLRNGIGLRDGDIVFDVGANIGLFTLSAHLAAHQLTVYAFEPNPTIFAKLRTNTELYGVDARLYCKGLAAEKATTAFTFYGKFSILSGLHADRSADTEVVRSFVRKHDDTGGTSYDSTLLEELFEDRLSGETIDVTLDTLSDVIAGAGVERIDLLKINVEKAEAQVLAGIRAADWPKIRQVALEVHDIDGRLDAIRVLLEEHGFSVIVQQDWRLEENARTNYYVYACRGEARAPSTEPPQRRSVEPVLDEDTLKDALRRQLPSHMVPAAIVFLEALPLTPSGKLDTRALAKAIAASAGPAAKAPQTETERRLAAIWCELLERQEIGVDDDFFRLGGHSLLATTLMARVNDAFSVALPLRVLFQAPTVAQLARQVDEAAQTTVSAVEGFDTFQIAPDPDRWSEPFRLTNIQEAYWLGRSAAFELGNAATQIYLELEQAGWDVARIEAAWNILVRRHDMLRAVILSEDRQRVLSQVPHYAIAMHDLSGSGAESVDAHLAALRSEMAGQMMQADRWPLFDIRATKLPGNVVRLHVSIDALIADAASLFQLFSEWERAYKGTEPARPLAIGFRDYVLAEGRLHNSDLFRRSEEYWLGRLDSLPPAPDLPLAKSPASLERPHFVRRSRRLTPEAWASLKSRAAEAGLTPSIVLVTAFAEALANWSASAHFTLNLTTFNRLPLHSDVAGLIGDFTTLTLLEADCRAPEPFIARARRLQARLWDDLEHRHMSGVSVLRSLAQRRRSGGSALMPVVFTSALDIDSGNDSRRFGEVVHSVSQTPQVWLDHQVMEWNGSLVLNWDAVEDIFPTGLLDDLAQAHGDLLERLAQSDAAWRQWEGGLIPAHQCAVRRRVNAMEAPIPAGRLEDGFLRQFQKAPDALAIIAGERQLTYADLHRRAVAVAHWLRERGCRPDQPVAIVMRKGWEQVVGVLGTLLADGAYVPIDPELPMERIRYVLDHCGIRCALTQTDVEQAIAWPEEIARLPVDGLSGSEGGMLAPERRGSPSDLAYILFTSGSTGVPKGVMIAHEAIHNSIADFNARYGVRAQDRILALSALSFDLSVFDIFGLLSAGGAIVMPEPGRLRDPVHWAELARRHNVSVWNSVPILMQMMVEALEPQPDLWPSSLRLVIMSGDWIPVGLPDRMRTFDPALVIHSQGGATETSINAFTYEIDAVDPAWKSIPYGTPLANQTGHILNSHLEPAPDWVPGELYVGGKGLARGYWKDPEKTDAAFIRHPRTGERLYRTGDYGRYWPDGTIEFLGRRDTQIKVSGHRIELGEIETVLAQHPDVEAAVVSAPPGPDGNRRLVAYVVQKPVPADDIASGADAEGVLTDPVARLTFKLERRGLRPAADGEEVIPLPGGAFDEERGRAYLRRQSYRRFEEGPVSLECIGIWLRALQECSVDGSAMPKFRYPSAGSLYPVQLYLVVKHGRVSGLQGGAYSYDPVTHRLVRIGDTTTLRDLYPTPNRPVVEAGAFSVLLVANMDAIRPMYGGMARDFSLLEAGYMGQLLMEGAPEAKLGLCPLGFIPDVPARSALGLGENHTVLHSYAAGGIEPAQMESWSPEEVSSASPQNELREWLRRKLPAYMVPATFVFLDELPLNANGKVDRRALPTPSAPEEPVANDADSAPQSDVERVLAEAVAAVLQQTPGHAESNFFDLGANSIHLVQIHRRVQDALDVRFPLVEIFQNPSVRRLAKWLASDGASELAVDAIQERAERTRAERRRRASRRSGAAAANDETGSRL